MGAGHLVSAGNVRRNGSAETRPGTLVGASYAFDPGADGMAGIYAARVLERGIDPRAFAPMFAPTPWVSPIASRSGGR